ncbi:hypothetical protein Landi51_05749 [Colletotrichum acutatum]
MPLHDSRTARKEENDMEEGKTQELAGAGTATIHQFPSGASARHASSFTVSPTTPFPSPATPPTTGDRPNRHTAQELTAAAMQCSTSRAASFAQSESIQEPAPVQLKLAILCFSLVIFVVRLFLFTLGCGYLRDYGYSFTLHELIFVRLHSPGTTLQKQPGPFAGAHAGLQYYMFKNCEVGIYRLLGK